MELSQAVHMVRVSRQVLQNVTSRFRDMTKKFDEETADIQRSVKEAKVAVERQEDHLRQMALEEYLAVPGHSKKIIEGVGIREMTQHVYDQEKLYEWCVKHNRFLIPDVGAFNDYLMSLEGSQLPEFVERTYRVTATIAQKL